jgi:heme exporter protein A
VRLTRADQRKVMTMTAVATQPHPTDHRQVAPAVVVRELVKQIDERPVLRGINLCIQAGEYVAILGANGTGKSTLLKLLSRLTAPTSGEIVLFGQPARRDASEIRRRIGLIDHQSLLYRDLTPTENLAFFGGLYGLPDIPRRIATLLGRFGLQQRANDPVKTFSRGMVQRLAIARALLHDPDLLLADEPFTGLDAPSIDLVERVFADLVAEGKTIIMVNHSVEQTLRLADRAIVLRGGRVAMDQPTHRLYIDELLAEVTGT